MLIAAQPAIDSAPQIAALKERLDRLEKSNSELAKDREYLLEENKRLEGDNASLRTKKAYQAMEQKVSEMAERLERFEAHNIRLVGSANAAHQESVEKDAKIAELEAALAKTTPVSAAPSNPAVEPSPVAAEVSSAAEKSPEIEALRERIKQLEEVKIMDNSKIRMLEIAVGMREPDESVAA